MKNSWKLNAIQNFTGFHKGSFSTDLKSLVLVDGPHIDVVDTTNGRTLAEPTRLDSSFIAAKFSPDDQILVTAYKVHESPTSESLKVAFWEAATGREKLTLPVVDLDWRRPIDDLSFSPDGRLLASSVGGIARLWNSSTGKEAQRFVPAIGPPDQQCERALLSPGGKLLAAYFVSQSNPSYKLVHLWGIETGQLNNFDTEIYRDWRFSADSRLLAVTAIVDKGKSTERSVAEIWDVTALKRVKLIEVPKEWRGAYTVAFSPDSSALAVGGYKKFGIYSVGTGELLAQETHHRTGFFQDSELPGELSHIEFSHDGKLLLTSGNDNRVILWKIQK